MYEEIYLEADEEVTSAIEKIKKSKKKNVALSLPRNAVLGQSIVNLKLVYREAAALGKQVALVSPDKVTRNLAERIGFLVQDSMSRISFPKMEKDEGSADSEAETKPTPKSSTPAKNLDDKEIVEPASAPLQAAGFSSQSINEEEDPTPPENEESEPEQKEESEPETLPLEPEPSKPEPAQAAAKTYQRDPGGMIPTRGNLRYVRHGKRRPFWIPLAIGVGLIIIGGIALAIMVPQAAVKITIAAQPFNETVNSAVDTEATAIDAEKAVIPGKVIDVSQVTKATAKATGKKDIGQKATGTVTMVNEWDSLSHTYAAGTKIKAKNGNEFVLTADVTVPGASSTVSAGQSVIIGGKKTVTVEAVVPGESYNNAPTTFTIPSLSAAQQDKIYATSDQAFTGGSSNTVTVVSQSDLDKLTENLKTQNHDDGLAEVKKQAGEAVLLDKAIQITGQEVAIAAAVDSQTDTIEGTMTGKFHAIVFSTQDQKQLLEKLLANKIPQGQNLVTEGDGVTFDTTQFDLNLVTDKRLELTNNLKAFTVINFDQNRIRRSLIGESPAAAQAIVDKIVSTQKVESHISPSWWPRLPYLASRLKIEYTYRAKDS